MTITHPYSTELVEITREYLSLRDQQLALYELIKSGRRNIHLDQALQLLAQSLTAFTSAEYGFVYVHHSGRAPALVEYPHPFMHPNMLAALIEKTSTGRYVVAPGDLTLADNPITNLLVVPFCIDESSTALLGAANGSLVEFQSPDLKMLQAIGEYAGGQIENLFVFEKNMSLARLQAELDLAQQVQVSLMPGGFQPPPGFDIWGVCNPAHHVGGDFFDFFYPSDDSFLFVAGDISGKGLPSALVMSMVRATVRTLLTIHPHEPPASLLKTASGVLYRDFDSLNMFTTLFAGQVRLTDDRLVYANAGHHPAVFIPAAGPPQILEADSTAVGIFPFSTSTDRSIQFRPGDLFVLSTDGLIEARSPDGQQFGMDNFLNHLARAAQRPAREIVESILETVGRFSKKDPVEDDQTVVVIKRIEKRVQE